mgnify:CR=1 FL=1
MYRAIITILSIAALTGCSTTYDTLVGEPVYFKHINDDVFWENVVVYGKLRTDVLRKPTGVYHSSFGHAYCMSEEVTFDVKKYILGAGPEVIEFSQNIIDFCRPIAENTGFGKSILFLSKNEHRGIWSTGSIRIDEIDGEARIFKPADIMHLLSFGNFESLLTDYEKPLEWGVDSGLLSERDLERLKEKGVLSYKLDPQDRNGDFYLLEMYKYIKVEALIGNDF